MEGAEQTACHNDSVGAPDRSDNRARQRLLGELRELRQDNERLRIRFDAAPDAIYIHDVKGTFLDANRAAERLIGGSKRELIGKSFVELGLLPARSLAQAMKALLANALGRPTGPEEFELRRLDGEPIFVEVSTFPIRQGNRISVVGVARDVSERRRLALELTTQVSVEHLVRSRTARLELTNARLRAEEAAAREAANHYQSVFDTAHDAVVIVDSKHHRILEVNRRAGELYETPRADLVGQSIVELSVDPSKEANRLRDLSNAQERRQFQTQHHRSDGSIMHLEVSASPMVYRGEDALLTMARDVTSRIEAEAAVRERDARLSQAKKMEAIGRLAAGVAHDFNNLLTVILTGASLAEARLDDGEDPAEDLQHIRDAGERASGLVRQLLTFSRREPTKPQPIDLAYHIRRIRKMLSRVLPSEVVLILDVCEGSAFIQVDPVQFDRVLVNLVVNAADSMPDGGQVTVAVRRAETDGASSIMVEVSDTGSGMDEAIASRIFEPFFSTKGAGGTGLGLALVYGIVRSSGGEIEVESEVGDGTTFSIRFPAVDESVTPLVEDRGPVSVDGAQRTVLVVDDDKLVADAVASTLRRANYDVITSNNPGEALLIAEKRGNDLDLILTDVDMPWASGHELASRVRNFAPALPILFMTGSGTPTSVPDREHDRTLRKPFGTDDLLAAISEVIAGTASEGAASA